MADRIIQKRPVTYINCYVTLGYGQPHPTPPSSSVRWSPFASTILRLPEVMARTGLSRSTIYVRLEQGRFPRPVSLGSSAVGWVEAEVDEWMRERIVESRSNAE